MPIGAVGRPDGGVGDFPSLGADAFGTDGIAAARLGGCDGSDFRPGITTRMFGSVGAFSSPGAASPITFPHRCRTAKRSAAWIRMTAVNAPPRSLFVMSVR